MLVYLIFGCSSEISYYGDIEPIIEARCVNCHFEGAIGGVDLSDADTVVEWSKAITNATSNRSMPPWSAEGNFSNDWSLSDGQISVIEEWVDLGTPLGEKDEPRRYVESIGTQLSKVDRSIFTMRDFAIIFISSI